MVNYYWLQNVLLIKNIGYYEFADNLWNFTSLNSYLLGNLIRGNGIISNYDNEYFYVYETNKRCSAKSIKCILNN
ncbi:thermopsin family protease [Candidatus Nanopusillus massiliensis]